MLQRRGLKVAMVTGDNAGTAKSIAAQLGIERVMAEVLPGSKADEIKKLRDAGEVAAWWATGSTMRRRWRWRRGHCHWCGN